MQSADGRDACASAIALAGLALALASAGFVPLGPRAWGFALWQYLPPAVGAAACLALAALASSRVRRGLLRGIDALAHGPPEGAARRRLAFWSALALLLVVLRERTLLGDSGILLYTARAGIWLHPPDLGATLVFGLVTRASDAAGVDPLLSMQAVVCAAALATVACVLGIAERCAAPSRRAAFAALALCGGLARVGFGHVEVYAFVLLGASAILLTSLRCLRGEAGPAQAALALGLGAFVHPSLLALAPTLPLAALRGARARGSDAGWVRACAWLGLAAALPLSLVLCVALLGSAETAARLRDAWSEILGRTDAPTRWVLAPGATSTHATELALFSAAQLRFLANSFAILAPFALPLVAIHVLRRPRSLWAPPEARLLATAAGGSALYALALRPMWGPYDWDLFSLTAFCVSLLAASFVCGAADAGRFAHRALAFCGASFLAAGMPWIAVGIGQTRDAGPFSRPRIERSAPDESGYDALGRHVAPWM